MKEEWKRITDFSYEVSNKGRVRKLNGSLMKPWKVRQGYLQVGLSRAGSRFKFLVHRLVAEAFLENLSSKSFVNHKNLDKSCNDLENLEWVSREENVQHYLQNTTSAPRVKYSEDFKKEVANFPGGMLESKRFYNLPTSTVQRWRKVFREAP